MRLYRVSRQWFRVLAERLDAVAVLYRVASIIATLDASDAPVVVTHCRTGPYDPLLRLPSGSTIGLVCQGPIADQRQPALPHPHHRADGCSRAAAAHADPDRVGAGHAPRPAHDRRPLHAHRDHRRGHTRCDRRPGRGPGRAPRLAAGWVRVRLNADAGTGRLVAHRPRLCAPPLNTARR